MDATDDKNDSTGEPDEQAPATAAQIGAAKWRARLRAYEFAVHMHEASGKSGAEHAAVDHAAELAELQLIEQAFAEGGARAIGKLDTLMKHAALSAATGAVRLALRTEAVKLGMAKLIEVSVWAPWIGPDANAIIGLRGAWAHDRGAMVAELTADMLATVDAAVAELKSAAEEKDRRAEFRDGAALRAWLLVATAFAGIDHDSVRRIETARRKAGRPGGGALLTACASSAVMSSQPLADYLKQRAGTRIR